MSNAWAWARIAAVFLGLAVFGLGALGLVDPQAAQLANDSDPFGVPPPRVHFVVQMIVGAVLVAWPVWAMRRRGGSRS